MNTSPFFPQLFESVPDALVIVDREGRILMANRNAAHLFGYAEGALVGRAVEDLMPDDIRARHRGYRAGYMEQPRVRPMGSSGMTLVGRRRDGQQFPVEIALSPLESDQGLHYLASIRDISETQRAQQALLRARYDAVVGRIGQLALAATDSEDVIDSIPALLSEVLKIPTVAVVLIRGSEPVLAAAVGDSGPGPSPWWLAMEGPLGRALKQDHPLVVHDVAAEAPPEWPPDVSSGAIVPLLDRDRPMGALLVLSGAPGRFDHDAIQLLQTVGNLIASLVQRRRTEELLAHAHRLDAIGQLTGGVAHDFNNLLTVMSGSLQLLESECEGRAGARELIDSALRSVERGAELTSKLLAFARQQHLSPRAIDPSSLVRDLQLMLGRTLGEAVVLEVECPSGTPAVFADPAQLESALVNLALNARDAMPDGGAISLSVDERVIEPGHARDGQRAGRFVVFTVEDDGRGMTPDVLARACEPFFTTKAIGRGSGLGLSMVYGFIRQSGGDMRIHSEPGEGARIELWLPAAAGAQVEPVPTPLAEVQGSGLVLVVEDEAQVRNIAAAFLRSLGYRVVAVESAGEALKQLAANDEFVLLFTDVMLGGGMNGAELAQAARSLRPRLGILLTSGYDEQAAQAATSSAPFELLPKPYRREELAVAARRNLPT
jgi:PAS domain S-box-containing protein